MRIGIKTITGIGIAAMLSLGFAVPAHADGNNSGDSLANATDNSKTISLTDAAVGFKYTSVGTDTVNFTWNPAAFGTAVDPITWCEVSLVAQKEQFAGFVTGYQTFEGNTTRAAAFGATNNGDGSRDVTVTPGATFRVNLLCHNASDLLRYNYNSPYFTAKEVPTDTPTKPFVQLYNGNDLSAAVTGAFPNGEAWADHCMFRLYKNGSLVKSVTDPCTGGTNHVFANLTAGDYQVSTATINPGGQSGWSVRSNTVAVKAGAATTTATQAPAKRAPSNVSASVRVNGKQVRLSWTKAATNHGAAIKQYRVSVTKGKSVKYQHTFAASKRVFTKTLAHGSYKVKITATNKAGKSTVTSFTLKL